MRRSFWVKSKIVRSDSSYSCIDKKKIPYTFRLVYLYTYIALVSVRYSHMHGALSSGSTRFSCSIATHSFFFLSFFLLSILHSLIRYTLLFLVCVINMYGAFTMPYYTPIYTYMLYICVHTECGQTPSYENLPKIKMKKKQHTTTREELSMNNACFSMCLIRARSISCYMNFGRPSRFFSQS